MAENDIRVFIVIDKYVDKLWGFRLSQRYFWRFKPSEILVRVDWWTVDNREVFLDFLTLKKKAQKSFGMLVAIPQPIWRT